MGKLEHQLQDNKDKTYRNTTRIEKLEISLDLYNNEMGELKSKGETKKQVFSSMPNGGGNYDEDINEINKKMQEFETDIQKLKDL